AALEPADPAGDRAESRVDLTEAVAREAPAPRGLRGRRRAKRRQRAAEHRHRQLRALNALLDVPPPALPPAPVRPALGVASAASVAAPDQTAAPPALRAAPTPGTREVASAPAIDRASVRSTPPDVATVAGGPPTLDPRSNPVEPAGPAAPSDDPWAGMAPLGDPDGVADPGVAVPWPADPRGPSGDVPPWPDEPPG
ncbi:MAG TPA: hypothetical protein PKA98_16290, partial [Acidimicrobiales bacterium]|nr:hypothetical protein [Acidimicrobiales bacterium]